MLTSMRLSAFLAWRFIQGTKDSSIQLMLRMSFLAIMISTFALTLVAAIMNGFEKATYEKLQGINTDIIIRSPHQSIDYEKVAAVLEKEYRDTVVASSPQSLGHALLSNNNAQQGVTPAVVVVIGIDPARQEVTSTLATTILRPKDIPFDLLFQNRAIMVGQQLADLFGLAIGDEVSLLFVPEEEPAGATITLARASATIGSIFKTGIDEYDTNVVFCSQELFGDLFPDAGIAAIGIKLAPHIDPAGALHALKKRFTRLHVYSWKDLYPALVEALALEKYAMIIILILISLMASMSIVALLFMLVTHKRADIAILITMGMSPANIGTIFIIMGMGIAVTATTTGLIMAIGASLLLTWYPIITLPDAYYVSHLPAHVSLSLVLGVMGITTLLSFLATWLPARRAGKLTATEILKHEG